MKRIKIHFIAGALLFGACDTLDQTPVSIISEANFYTSGADAESAIIGVYDALQVYALENMLLPPTIMSDEGDAVRGGNYTRTEVFGVTPNDGHIGNMWQDAYRTIGRVNDVLENVPGINDPRFAEADRNRILGEAYFMRGFLNLHLVRRFGNVPLVTEAFNSPEQNYQPARDDKDVVYNQIIEDLQLAKELLPVNVANKARVSRWAAAGILAKTYLDRNGQGDKESALAELNSIISSDEYQLVTADQYFNLFEAGGQNTAETIFEVSFRPMGVEDANYDNEYVPSQNFRVEPSFKMINAFKEDSALVAESGKEEVRMAAAIHKHTVPLAPLPDGDPRLGYFIDKYSKDDWTVIQNRQQLHPNVIVLRLADVILLKAEIENEMGNIQEAISLLNQIRDRVNLPPTTAVSQEGLRFAIEDERYKELAFEGHRFHDLVRTQRAVDVINNKGVVPTVDRLIWPIPQADIDQNPNLLPQNPSY